MAFFALDPNTLNLKHIDWFQEHRIEQGLCAVCGTKMEIRAAHPPILPHIFGMDEISIA